MKTPLKTYEIRIIDKIDSVCNVIDIQFNLTVGGITLKKIITNGKAKLPKFVKADKRNSYANAIFKAIEMHGGAEFLKPIN
jgi:hypothetical protein